MRYCNLKQKEVINILDGSSLGFINDLVLDECTGRICSIVVPGMCGFKSIFHSKCYIIPWENICKIGEDVILIEVDITICSVAE